MTVSIIMPVYQVSNYIERCLLSVMKQDYSDIECIIVNDATKDDSMLKCEKLINDYQGPIEFKIIHHPVNQGLSIARNTGTEAATGDYLYYLDSDDEITPDCIRKLVTPIKEDKSIQMVQGNHISKQEDKSVIFYKGSSPMVIMSNNDVYDQFLHTINVNAWNKLLKRSFVLEHNLTFKEKLLCEDMLWMFYLMKHLEKAYLCNDVTYYYYDRPDSIMSGTDKKVLGNHMEVIYNEILNNLTIGKEKQELRAFLYVFCRWYIDLKRTNPSFKNTFNLFKRRAKQHGCYYDYSVLTMVGLMSQVGNPLDILRKLNNLRLKITG